VAASAYRLATIGVDTLVPPGAIQFGTTPPCGTVSNTATGVNGSPTADTSTSVRFWQPAGAAAWSQLAGDWSDEQPEPVPDHAVSVQPRVFDALRSEVPPTAVTFCAAAGNSVPYPESPAAATMATP